MEELLPKLVKWLEGLSGALGALPLWVLPILAVLGILAAVVTSHFIGNATGAGIESRVVAVFLTVLFGLVILCALSYLWWYVRIGATISLSDFREMSEKTRNVVFEIGSFAQGFLPVYLAIWKFVFEQVRSDQPERLAKNQAFRNLSTTLDLYRDEYIHELYQTNVLRRSKREEIAGRYTLKLAVATSEFCQAIQVPFDTSPQFSIRTEESKRKLPLAEVAGGAAGGAGVGVVSAMLPVATSGFWIFTKTLALSAVVGAAVGIPPAAVTAGFSLIAGIVVFLVMLYILGRNRKESIRARMIQKYDHLGEAIERWAAKSLQKASR